MTFTAQQIALLLQGEIEGNPNAEITTFAKIEEGCSGALSFLANIKYEDFIYTCESSVVIVNKDFEPKQETGWHIHEYDNVITAITDCFMMLQHPDGTETLSEVASGNAYIRDAGVHHNVINKSNQKMSFIEIEFKKSRINK